MKHYVAIDLKSFYASVECIERGLDPFTTNLVVADESRTSKTICLAATPAIKIYGVPGRARLFEVEQKIKAANKARKPTKGKSYDLNELNKNPHFAVDYIVAKPRMALYMKYSTKIYSIYLRYIAPEDIHIYSVDEVFIDITNYLQTYDMTAHELTLKLVREVLKETGITATAGIGTNLYLAKIAMDIVAKKMTADKDGVRIAELDEMSYRKKLWAHTPLTDFWRVGKGYANKLKTHGIYTMGDIARCSIDYEELLYKLFGINAEFLIDHAWGYEPCTIEAIKAYKPTNHSLSSGQVLQEPYSHEKARLIVWEMTDLLVLDLVAKGLVTDQMVLNIGYDIENMKSYKGEVHTDHYGRTVPKPTHGSINLNKYTSSSKDILNAIIELYDRIANPALLVRRITVTANRVIGENGKNLKFEEIDLFADKSANNSSNEKEKSLQHALIDLKDKFGKNAILKAANLQEGAMTIERNKQVGGHRA
ncbi:MAG: DNA methylase [Selenomonadaceae bacterium]|nr:DNA methylase [Selenomonadaceae bacterium]